MVSIMLHVCYNNEKKIGVKPGNSRNETGQQSETNIFWSLHGYYEVTTKCVPDSISRLFHEWLKFRADTRIILVTYAAFAFQIRFRYVSNLVSFRSTSTFCVVLLKRPF